jgi:hypothetical protein
MGTNLECDVDVEGAVGMMDHGEDRDTHMPRKVDPRLRSRMAAPAPYTHWIGKGPHGAAKSHWSWKQPGCGCLTRGNAPAPCGIG